MKAEIKVPSVGESITEATIGEWAKKSGEFVKRDEVILLLETDKASVEVVAPNDGVLTTTAKQGETVKIGAVVASIDTEGVATAGMAQPAKNTDAAPKAAPVPAAPAAATPNTTLSPAVRRVVDERGLNPADVKGTGKEGRLTKQDVVKAPQGGMGAYAGTGPGTPATAPAPAAAKKAEIPPLPAAKGGGPRTDRRVAMSTIRKKTAERLVQSQHTTATLTTFNEVDMTAVLALREKYKERYKEKYGVSLGFMGFFVKATVEALREQPQVNAFIDGGDLIFHDYINVGIAVGTDKGLMVPVVRDADQLTIAEVEQSIRHYALKARDGKISIDDLSSGTFTITNGGVFGSLMSTPILNPPQSAILGLHKVEERAVVINGKIEVRSMMYLALSYDHRVIDGKEAVTFLVRIKEGIEDPSRLLLEI